ncbi:glycosyltransferase family A protein [soil metagenome]
MKIYIIIPAYNEAAFIGKTLSSLAGQSLLPKKIVVVNDHSGDATGEIVDEFSRTHDFISQVHLNTKVTTHSPGSKVIRAFNIGFKDLDEDYDIICKFDADLIFPEDYLEKISSHFKSNPSAGMAGGFCTVLRDNRWVIENLTGKDHIRGALKAYRKKCFLEIGKLKEAMGWDTVDELLARYHGWEIITDSTLLVKHLKPTGSSYSNKSGFKQGAAFYRLRYGARLTIIASAKLAYFKKDLKLFRDYLGGYYRAKKEKQAFLVSEEEGRFIRKLRWRNIGNKFLLI